MDGNDLLKRLHEIPRDIWFYPKIAQKHKKLASYEGSTDRLYDKLNDQLID